MRTFLVCGALLVGCGPAVSLTDLSDQQVVFAAQQSESGEITGVISLLKSEPGIARKPAPCKALGDGVTLRFHGKTLERTSGACARDEFSDRWVLPITDEDQTDLNVVFTDELDGVVRVVIAEALEPVTFPAEVQLRPDTFVTIPFSARALVRDVHVAFIDETGERWSRESMNFVPGDIDRDRDGVLIVTGTALREATACRGFASCTQELRFTATIGAITDF